MKIVIMAICLLLCGCANIPLGTMLKVSSFDQNTFLELNPEDLRTRIHLDMPRKLLLDRTKLSVELKTSQGESISHFPLRLLSSKLLAEEEGWLNSIPARTEYNLALSPEAIKSFKKLQKLMESENPESVRFNISATFAYSKESKPSAVMSVFLKLHKATDYMTLFDRATLEIKQKGRKLLNSATTHLILFLSSKF